MRKKLIDWYLSHEAIPYWCILLVDSLVVYGSGVLAYIMNHGLSTSVGELLPLSSALLAYMVFFLAGFRLFHIYSGVIRRSTFSDLVRVVLALLVGAIGVMVARVLGSDTWLLTIRLRDLLLQVLMATVLMCGSRVCLKSFYDFYLRHYSIGNVYGLSDNVLFDMEMCNLLPRTPIHVDMEQISQELKGKRIMVTGAAGSIGSELAGLIAACGPESLILIDQAETPLHDVGLKMKRLWPEVSCRSIITSVCHSHRMENILKESRPELIFHAAAYKHVPVMEDNPIESILNNVDGTRKLADLAVRYGVGKFIMISTDKAVNPTSVMGCSKRICEIYCQSLAKKIEGQHAEGGSQCQFITTRFGNVLGSNGSVIPVFRDQIRRGGPVCVTHPDITRYFMLIPEACQLVLEASTIGHGGEIFVFDMGRPVRITDLAKRMIKLSGRTGIKITYTGLRPGEKLYEEVLADEEKVLPTRHSKIKIAKVRGYDFDEVRSMVDDLVSTARAYDEFGTIKQMKRIVPEYNSLNKRYQEMTTNNQQSSK